MFQNEHKAKLLKLLDKGSYVHDRWKVFADFCTLLSCAIANSVDWPQRKKREERYLQTIKQYDKDTQALFPQMAGELTLALQGCAERGEYTDILGETFEELGVNNNWKGQFFTPQSVSDAMAMLSLGNENDFDKHLVEKGYVSVYEPACGAGSTILGFMNAYRQIKPDAPFNKFVVHAGDIDERCVHMAYIQLSLYGVPAVIKQRNALSMELIGETWYTPVYIIDGWEWREAANKSRTLHDTTDSEEGGGQVLSTPEKENPPDAWEVEMSLF